MISAASTWSSCWAWESLSVTSSWPASPLASGSPSRAPSASPGRSGGGSVRASARARPEGGLSRGGSVSAPPAPPPPAPAPVRPAALRDEGCLPPKWLRPGRRRRRAPSFPSPAGRGLFRADQGAGRGGEGGGSWGPQGHGTGGLGLGALGPEAPWPWVSRGWPPIRRPPAAGTCPPRQALSLRRPSKHGPERRRLSLGSRAGPAGLSGRGDASGREAPRGRGEGRLWLVRSQDREGPWPASAGHDNQGSPRWPWPSVLG